MYHYYIVAFLIKKKSVSNIHTPYHSTIIQLLSKSQNRLKRSPSVAECQNISSFVKPATVGTGKNISENRTIIKKDIRFGVEVLPCQFTQHQTLILTQEILPRNRPYKVFSALHIPTHNIVHEIIPVTQITRHYIISTTLFTLFLLNIRNNGTVTKHPYFLFCLTVFFF